MEQVSTKSLRVWWPPGEAASDRFFDVLDRYSEPHRRYHSEVHVMWVATWCFWLCSRIDTADPQPVMLAALFHDAVYDPQAADNEAQSALLARHELTGLGVDSSLVAEVERLIGVTAHHRVATDDSNAAVLCDADLSVLGAHRPGYERYALDVRAEYAHVTDRDWRRGRAAVLLEFLARPRIFQSLDMLERLEEQARANLAWELSTLKG